MLMSTLNMTSILESSRACRATRLVSQIHHKLNKLDVHECRRKFARCSIPFYARFTLAVKKIVKPKNFVYDIWVDLIHCVIPKSMHVQLQKLHYNAYSSTQRAWNDRSCHTLKVLNFRCHHIRRVLGLLFMAS